jgi:hypothetical protein
MLFLREYPGEPCCSDISDGMSSGWLPVALVERFDYKLEARLQVSKYRTLARSAKLSASSNMPAIIGAFFLLSPVADFKVSRIKK